MAWNIRSRCFGGRWIARLVGLLVPALVWAAPAGAAEGGRTVDFSRDVRPILADKCFQCHGPDEPRRKAGLRLDIADGAVGETPLGSRAVVPGDIQESELYWRITAPADDESRMPPARSGKVLTPEEIKTLSAWIEQGAVYRQHWAFTPPTRPAVPAVRDPAWCRTPIDRFILARLEQEGLKPAPEADQVTLLRRLSLDLTGLPPTVEEVERFLADAAPDAYERQVRRLLDSPHYGERWGRLWLDAARYADSDGYEKDKLRQVWFYRDWVINALNQDLPYDRFLIEQIAGDLLPGATQDQVVATGFLRNSMINEEGGINPEQFRMEAMFDRMEAVGAGILGLTIQCARCHTHKFDPLTHDDYYRMFAFLNDSHEANVAVYTPEEQEQRDRIFREIREIEADLQHRAPDWAERMAAWEEQVRADPSAWTVVRPTVLDDSTGGQKYLPREDGSFLAQGYAPTKHRATMTVRVEAPTITAFRLELLNDPDLPLGGPGRSIKGTAALTEFEAQAAPADAPEKVETIKLARASADVNPPETPLEPIFDDKSGKRRVTGPIDFAIDGKDETAWGIDVGPGRRNQPRQAVFVAETPIAHPQGTILTFFLKQNHGGWNSDDNQNQNLGRFRLSITAAPAPSVDPLPADVRSILAIPGQRRTPAQVAAIFGSWRTTVPEWREANGRIEALWRRHPEGSTQLVLQTRQTPRATHLLERGDFLKPAHEVGPGVPAFLNPLPADAPPTRLTFARWLADRRAPTTARALVNRVWQADFGTGLVATSEDLGLQGEPPSHPELLDWLAVEFMDRGWSLKELHRLIVTSATYRQSSRVPPALASRDPYNRLLARGPRFRVDAEVVRDIVLAAGGLLSAKVGGPSVFPPAPAFLFQPPASYGPKVWPEATGPDRYRRALYTFRYRSVPYPALQAFDAPNGDVACVRRSRSNTPLQALTTLNEPIFLEGARALALRTIERGGSTDGDRLAYAFRRCLARTPTAPEAAALLDLLERQESRFSGEGINPWDLAAADPAHPPRLPEGVTPAQLAAWTAVSRVLLNLDETITKE
ncbi:MAG TPA: PSD1 and planctomycete cytochrome C domain-containing protein [Isosphaeraceae bacterium]|jgi:mono/diheme cytochrome c family protein